MEITLVEDHEALGAHVEFDETSQKMQLRHDLARTSSTMGVLDSWWSRADGSSVPLFNLVKLIADFCHLD